MFSGFIYRVQDRVYLPKYGIFGFIRTIYPDEGTYDIGIYNKKDMVPNDPFIVEGAVRVPVGDLFLVIPPPPDYTYMVGNLVYLQEHQQIGKIKEVRAGGLYDVITTLGTVYSSLGTDITFIMRGTAQSDVPPDVFIYLPPTETTYEIGSSWWSAYWKTNVTIIAIELPGRRFIATSPIGRVYIDLSYDTLTSPGSLPTSPPDYSMTVWAQNAQTLNIDEYNENEVPSGWNIINYPKTEIVTEVIVTAKNPITGEVSDFPNPNWIPPGWTMYQQPPTTEGILTPTNIVIGAGALLLLIILTR